jgi:hypothetical protein
MTNRTDSGGSGTEGSRDLPGTHQVVTAFESRQVSSFAVSGFPVSGRVIVARGAGVRSVEIPFDLKRERARREHLVANRGEEPQSSTAEG